MNNQPSFSDLLGELDSLLRINYRGFPAAAHAIQSILVQTTVQTDCIKLWCHLIFNFCVIDPTNEAMDCDTPLPCIRALDDTDHEIVAAVKKWTDLFKDGEQTLNDVAICIYTKWSNLDSAHQVALITLVLEFIAPYQQLDPSRCEVDPIPEGVELEDEKYLAALRFILQYMRSDRSIYDVSFQLQRVLRHLSPALAARLLIDTLFCATNMALDEDEQCSGDDEDEIEHDLEPDISKSGTSTSEYGDAEHF